MVDKNIRILQLIFAAGPKESGGWFNQLSISEGISEAERIELSKMANNIFPKNLLSDNRLANDVLRENQLNSPLSFSFFKLNSGRYGVCQAKYITTGDGNEINHGYFLGHVLLLENGKWPFYPIELYNSAIFREKLLQEEIKYGFGQQPLPVLNEVPFGVEINRQTATDFISANRRRKKILIRMVNYVVNFSNEGKRLIILDRLNNSAKYIAALQMAFPVKLAHYITFSTNCNNLEQMDYFLVSTLKNEIKFEHFRMRERFNLIDVQILLNNFGSCAGNNIDSEIIGGRDIFLAESCNLPAFYQFLDKFDYEAINDELNSAYNLFKLVSTTGCCGLNNQEIAESINFANKYAPGSLLIEVFDRVGNVLLDNIGGTEINSGVIDDDGNDYIKGKNLGLLDNMINGLKLLLLKFVSSKN